MERGVVSGYGYGYALCGKDYIVESKCMVKEIGLIKWLWASDNILK